MTDRRVVGGLLAFVALVYLNSFPGAFHFDDFALMLDNPDVTGGGFQYFGFLEQYGGRPLTLLSFHWNYLLWGRDPVSFHAFNVVLHGLCAAGFFFAVRGLLEQLAEVADWTALGAALVFAVHPLQTQSVNYVWSRSVLLMAVFGLFSMVAVRRWPWLAIGFWQLAIWSRTEGLVFLVPLLWLAPRRWRVLGAVAGLNLAGFFWGMARTAPREVGWAHSDALGYWVSQPVVFWKYLSLMVWPVGQTVDHDVTGFAWPWAVAGFIGWGVVGWLAWSARKGFPEGLVGWIWVGLFLAPGALVPNSDLFNESRAYLATGGLAIVLGGVAARLAAAPRTRVAAWAGGSAVLLALGGLTLARNRVWNDDLPLWREAVERSPGKARAHYNLGFALAQRGEVAPAEAAFLRARDLNPGDDLSYAALGYCAEVQQRFEAARQFYQQALRLQPGNEYARQGAARVESGGGQPRGVQGAEEPKIQPMGVRP